LQYGYRIFAMKMTGKGIKEKAEFEKLFKAYFKALVNFANKFLNDPDASKEIVHDVFVNLWEKRHRIDPEKSIKSYLYTSVNNRSLNYIRDHKKFVNNDMLLLNEHTVEQNDQFAEAEIQRIINYSLESLPPKTRKVFEMSRNEGLKYREIAEGLNISEKTVETHMSKALKVLRKNLKAYLTVFLLILFNW
jgi:RNA polymerase sigma-70 factor, ECF subfamily